MMPAFNIPGPLRRGWNGHQDGRALGCKLSHLRQKFPWAKERRGKMGQGVAVALARV